MSYARLIYAGVRFEAFGLGVDTSSRTTARELETIERPTGVPLVRPAGIKPTRLRVQGRFLNTKQARLDIAKLEHQINKGKSAVLTDHTGKNLGLYFLESITVDFEKFFTDVATVVSANLDFLEAKK